MIYSDCAIGPHLFFCNYSSPLLENGIDETALKLLKEDDIRDLIPKIGDRVKVLDALKKEVSKQLKQL